MARFFASWGAYVVDADRVARDVVAPGGPAYDVVVERFGRSILAGDGTIDRVELGRIVFDNAAEREALEAILHPVIREESKRRFTEQAGDAPLGIFEASLLVETGAHEDFDCLIVVACEPQTQIARLIERDGLGEDDARKRIAAQYPLEKKIALADHVIDTDGSLEQTELQARAVWDVLTGGD
ncbi:MAG: dephospho-CoA kinase [Acidobacteria bacterium]|nr:dephospho-CoA kinase [Acidobacteriota bacterium]NIM63323.1 dephospho-CoA kinase [Acidobacteriota bacterium]NIO60507.1 dephospho-CoA kinase [Acidobacteriota bacterium]NIQ31627.1 dephospho-CoA kinase [Acidobacteriota bacterium]NIQ87114.1 dephospho-CoA kinase [Acidobacteriota bacterium]